MKQAFSLWSRRKKALVLTLSTLGVLVIAGLLWGFWLNIDPVVHIPTQVMPVPNAFDDYVAAADSIRDADKIGFAVGKPTGSRYPTANDHPYSIAEKAGLVTENAGAISRL